MFVKIRNYGKRGDRVAMLVERVQTKKLPDQEELIGVTAFALGIIELIVAERWRKRRRSTAQSGSWQSDTRCFTDSIRVP